MADASVTFVQISDTHLHVNPNFTGDLKFAPRAGVAALIQDINQLPFEIDFILHTGDIMNDPEHLEDYQVAGEIFSQFKVAVYAIPGNHDRSEGVRRFLSRTPHSYYTFEARGVQIIALDSSRKPDHHGYIDDEQLAWLDSLCSADDKRPLVVALHHHPLPIQTPWLDQIALRNSDAVHQILLKAKNRLRCVLYGHIHEQTCVMRDGITYISALSSWFQTRTWQGQNDPVYDTVQFPGFNVVTITGRDTLVRNYRVPFYPGK